MKTLITTLALIVILSYTNIYSQTFQWVRSGGSTTSDNGAGVDVDASGNVYATGDFTGTATFGTFNATSSGSSDVYIIKYNSAGVAQWLKKGGGTGYDAGHDIAVAPNGSFFITGEFSGTATFGTSSVTAIGSSDIFIARYNSAGTALWAIRAGGLFTNKSTSISVDNQNNVYITGYYTVSTTIGTTTLNSSGLEDVFVAKYNSAGVFQWAVGGGGVDKDFGNGIANDNNGNVFVTGSFGQTANFSSINLSTGNANDSADIFVLKYNNAGNIQWGKRAGGLTEDRGFDISTDVNGDCYVTGFFTSTNASFNNLTISPYGNADMFIARYNSAGNICWVRKGGGTNSEQGYSIKTDPLGNSYVMGFFSSNPSSFGSVNLIPVNYDIFIVKYNNFGTCMWGNRADGSFWNYSNSRISADPNGNAYITGTYLGTANYGIPAQTINSSASSSDAYICKLSPQANLITGKCFYDFNTNGIMDNTDFAISSPPVTLNPGNAFVNANSNGDYYMYTSTGTYTVLQPAVNSYYSSTPTNYTVNFGTLGNTALNKDFAMQPIGTINDLQITMTLSAPVFPNPNTGRKYYVTIKNVGTTIMSGSVVVSIDNNLNYNAGLTTPAPANVTGNTVTWNYSNLYMFQTMTFQAGITCPLSTPVNTNVSSSATVNPVGGDITPLDNATALSHVVVASYDPNKKEVSPTGPFYQSNVTNQDWLTYTVYFQNTGTDTARNIVLVDTMSSKLYVPSLEMLSSSHPYTTNIKGSGIAEWTFSNIMLPDSTTNEKASHGFIKYRIKCKNNLVNGDIIKNWADIFFDFNSPVRTDTANTPIVIMPTLLSVQWNLEAMYPNAAVTTFILRNSQSPYEIVDSVTKTTSMITPNGYLETVEFNNVNDSDNYYVELKHRNSLETWSSGFVRFDNQPVMYDFTLSLSQAYGDNMKNVNGIPCFYSGEINADGIIDAGDVIAVYNDTLEPEDDEPVTDLNGDEIVDVTDVIIVYNNSINVVTVARP